MPHTRSARKNLRKSHKRRLRNRAAIRAIKIQVKAVLAAARSGAPAEQLQKEFNLAAKKLDKAAARRIVHPNLAARKKSQLAKLVHQKQQPAKQGT